MPTMTWLDLQYPLGRIKWRDLLEEWRGLLAEANQVDPMF